MSLTRDDAQKTSLLSFGIVMFEIFSRKEPYEGEDDMIELLNKIIRRKHRPCPPAKMPIEFVNLMKVRWYKSRSRLLTTALLDNSFA